MTSWCTSRQEGGRFTCASNRVPGCRAIGPKSNAMRDEPGVTELRCSSGVASPSRSTISRGREGIRRPGIDETIDCHHPLAMLRVDQRDRGRERAHALKRKTCGMRTSLRGVSLAHLAPLPRGRFRDAGAVTRWRRESEWRQGGEKMPPPSALFRRNDGECGSWPPRRRSPPIPTPTASATSHPSRRGPRASRPIAPERSLPKRGLPGAGPATVTEIRSRTCTTERRAPAQAAPDGPRPPAMGEGTARNQPMAQPASCPPRSRRCKSYRPCVQDLRAAATPAIR